MQIDRIFSRISEIRYIRYNRSVVGMQNKTEFSRHSTERLVEVGQRTQETEMGRKLRQIMPERKRRKKTIEEMTV